MTAHDRRVELYGYLLTTGSRESVRDAHEAAFENLSSDDLEALFRRLQETANTADERPDSAHPDELARIATEREFASPGKLAVVLDSPASPSSPYPTLLESVAHGLPKRTARRAAWSEWLAGLDEESFE